MHKAYSLADIFMAAIYNMIIFYADIFSTRKIYIRTRCEISGIDCSSRCYTCCNLLCFCCQKTDGWFFSSPGSIYNGDCCCIYIICEYRFSSISFGIQLAVLFAIKFLVSYMSLNQIADNLSYVLIDDAYVISSYDLKWMLDSFFLTDSYFLYDWLFWTIVYSIEAGLHMGYFIFLRFHLLFYF